MTSNHNIIVERLSLFGELNPSYMVTSTLGNIFIPQDRIFQTLTPLTIALAAYFKSIFLSSFKIS